ncbi:MAG: glycosyltransferase family 2 protein, partial [Mangrovicoccus sp.]|nr:glycosyltransferase family 2 protein [Mangrovicoccus sp.]
GLVTARQRAVAEATTPWIGFVDDDCHLAPDWIAAAQAAIAAHPAAGAIGGRVVPAWAPGVPKSLRKHGWIFAEQDHGPRDCEVGSLVGTGLVVNRAALAETGWPEAPLLEDRIGRGATSGGDVEMSFRLRSAGRALWYAPGMRLDHMVDQRRQSLRGMLQLSSGLGAGSAMVTLLAAPAATAGDPAAAGRFVANAAEVEASGLRRGWSDLRVVLARKYGFADWLIYRAFSRGRLRQLRALTAAPDLLRRIAGRSPQPPLPDEV